MTLDRKGHTDVGATTFGDMDDLSYAYDSGNKLLKVTDGIGGTAGEGGFKDGTNTNDDFEYDDNGNLEIDRNKGITSITYNHLNLPTSISISSTESGTISYIYDATGVKLRKSVLKNGNTTSTDYAGNYIYENDNLKQISQPEGYIEPDGNSYQYVYYLKDHQNNVRITFADDNGNGNIETGSSYSEIRREQNYYPYGLEHKGYNSVSYGVKNNLKTFQDQEFTEDLGLNTHEWRYRISDPAIGRFWQVDPLAEEYSYQSPYNFSENRVIDGIELEGLEYVPINGDGIARALETKIVKASNAVSSFFSSIGSAITNALTPKRGSPIYGNGTGGDSTRDDGKSSGPAIDTNDLPTPAGAGGSTKSKILNTIDTGLSLFEAGQTIGEQTNVIVNEVSTITSGNSNSQDKTATTTIQLQKKNPSFGYNSSNGQVINSTTTTLKDSTVNVNDANNIQRVNDSIENKKVSDAYDAFRGNN